MFLLSLFLLVLAVSAAPTENKSEKKLRPRKLNSSAPQPTNNFNDLGRIEARPLGKTYKDVAGCGSGSESDSDSISSSDSGAETEVDVQVPQQKNNLDHYYSSTDDLYNLDENDANKQFYYKK